MVTAWRAPARGTKRFVIVEAASLQWWVNLNRALPSGEASQRSCPPKTASFKPAKSEPAILKLAIIHNPDHLLPELPRCSSLYW